LARKYKTLVLEDFDLRVMARRGSVEDGAENEDARSNRQLAAVSELRLCLEQAFKGRGGDVVRLPAANTTRRCHACGHTEAFDAAAAILHTCPGCAATWDQDRNAALNLLATWQRERLGNVESGGPARSETIANDPAALPETKWTRAKRMRAAKDDRALAAREVAANLSK